MQFDQASPEIRQADAKRKEKIKEYADKHNHAKNTDLSVGDKVLIKQTKQNKMSTPFKPETFEITDKKESMITAQNAEHTVTRNASFFKKLPSKIPVHPIPSDEEEQSAPFVDTAEAVEPIKTVKPPTVTPVQLPAFRRSARARRVPDHFKDYVT